jgi:hypothetical protein
MRVSTSRGWLSPDMAAGLAALSPALDTSDVVRAADQLATNTPTLRVLNGLLARDAQEVQARQVVEALLALRELLAEGNDRAG